MWGKSLTWGNERDLETKVHTPLMCTFKFLMGDRAKHCSIMRWSRCDMHCARARTRAPKHSAINGTPCRVE